MRKSLIYISFLALILSSCEEVYHPAIDTVQGQLVVEAQITNNPDPKFSFVHLTKTTSFYDKQTSAVVTGATVELVELNGPTIKANSNGPGYFSFSTLPVPGKSYQLRIIIQSDIFESEKVTMPPIPTVNSFYTGHIVKKKYQTDAFGTPIAFDVAGRELYIDAPITPDLSYYRFQTRAVLEWSYNPPSIGPPLPPHYGWQSHYPDGNFNIAGPKKFSQNNLIEKHPLMMLPYNAKELYLQPDSIMAGWIIIVDQFGSSAGSYDYHEKLNSQLNADGSLFDPVQTQIYGNITCISNPSKIVYGYFDLNSYQQFRYFMYITSPAMVLQREILRYPTIPEEGDVIRNPPDWWE